jgi:predicted HicB family RNase H-like nuclease
LIIWAHKNNETMIDTMEIEDHRAVIQFDSEIDMFCGEFIGLNGGADFYA